MRKIIYIFLSVNILFISLFINVNSVNAANPISGANALKGIVIGSLEKAGVKFGNSKAKQRAYDKWQLNYYEKWRADELSGKNEDLWNLVETVRLNPDRIKVEPIADKPGFGRVLLDATLFGAAIGIGWDIGNSFWDSYNGKEPLEYYLERFDEVALDPNVVVTSAYGYTIKTKFKREYGTKPSYYRIHLYNELENSYDVILGETYSPETVNWSLGQLYSANDPNYPGRMFLPITLSYFDKNNEAVLLETKIPVDVLEHYNSNIINKYSYVTKESDLPQIVEVPKLNPLIENIPKQGLPENIPELLPTLDPVEIIINIDDPFGDNPYNFPGDFTNIPEPEPEPEPETEPEPEPDPNVSIEDFPWYISIFGILKDILNGILNIFDWLISFLDKLYDLLKGLFEPLFDLILNVLGPIGDILQQIFEWIIGFFNMLEQILNNIFGSILDGILNILNSIFSLIQNIVNWIDTFFNTLQNILTNLFSILFIPSNDFLQNELNPMKETIIRKYPDIPIIFGFFTDLKDGLQECVNMFNFEGEIFGVKVDFIDIKPLLKASDYYKPVMSAVMWFFTLAYAYRKITTIIFWGDKYSK